MGKNGHREGNVFYLDDLKTTQRKTDGSDPFAGGEAPQESEVCAEQWKELFELAETIRLMEPWETLTDSFLTCIRLPGREEGVYISVMGNGGMCYAIAVYPGYRGLASLQHLMQAPETEPDFIKLGLQDCLLCNFGCRDEVSPEDRAVYAQLGLKFRGKNRWVYFRSIRPGYAPWYLDAAQAALLTETLQNFIVIFRALCAGEVNVDFENGDMLTRWYDPEQNLWINGGLPQAECHVKYPAAKISDQILLSKIKRCEQASFDFSLDMFYLPLPMQEKKTDVPHYPRLVLLVQNDTMELLGQRTADDTDDVAVILLHLLADCMTDRGRPEHLHVRGEDIACYVEDFCRQTGIVLIKNQGLPAIDLLANSLIHFLSE